MSSGRRHRSEHYEREYERQERKNRSAELYHFVKSSSSSSADGRRNGSGGTRLFVQATREGDDRDNVKDIVIGNGNLKTTRITSSVGDNVRDLQAVYTSRRITTDVEGSSQHSSKVSRSRPGTKSVTTRVVRKTTTVTRGEEKSSAENLLKSSRENSLSRSSAEKILRRSEHTSRAKRAKISDIVVGEEPNVSAKEALLKWARRTTSKYPGVRVSDFTSSWRDGLAFNAIVHRNRPDLIDWRTIRSRTVRDRLETAFYVAEREYGVTRLLDPEDVDTHEIDEKSIITYISSLYDVFPEPPAVHPLYDSESQQKLSEYKDVASSLHLWMREKLSVMSDRNFPPTLIEMKKLSNESNRFRIEEVPPRHRDKQRLQHIYRDLQKYFETTGEVDLDPELHIDTIDRSWNRLMMAHQERDHIIHDEIKRLERLQRLAEKIHREIKRVDTKLEDTESKINDEARRLERLHPLDAKHNVDILEQELRTIEENIQSLFSDVHILRDGKYPQSSDLQKRVEKLHQRWVNLRSLLHSRLIAPLSSMSFPIVEERVVTRHTSTVLETRLVDTNPHFRNLQECIDWCSKKLKQLQEAEYGSDLPSVQSELSSHLREQKAIEQFQSRAEQCINAKVNFHGEELSLYMQYLNTLQKIYTELLTTSNKRLSDLETLQDFLQSATNQLVWLNEKEEIELTRDWTDRDLNLSLVQQYYETLMSELEKREIQFSAVQDRGESLLLQHHPASKCIEAYMTAMSNQWSWILQLTICLETHLKHATYYQQFFKDIKEAEVWINKRDELLNTVYSQSDFTLDEGERLLKGMQELKEELNQYGEVVASLGEKAQDVVPLKQRRQPVTRPIPILAICNYKQGSVNIEKGEQWVLHDNSGRIKWRVSNGANGSDCNIPGVVFLIPPPDKEALDAVERLKRQFDRSVLLWQRKQLRMRQNMIFSTIKVVRSWDLAQFLAMGSEQRNAIRKALNEDAAKLLEEGDPTDPQLRRLRREMDEVNKLFDEFEQRARLEEESKNATRIFNDQAASLQSALNDAEHSLNTRLNSPIARDIDSLEHLVIQHKDFETRLKGLTPEIEAVQETYRNIVKKTPALQSRLDRIVKQWDTLWNNSNIYIDRLKSVETILNGIDDANQVISDFEIKLAAFREMPSDIESLRSVQTDLLAIQEDVKHHEPLIDQLMKDGLDTKRLVESSRHHIHRGGQHHDLDRLDADLNKINARWNNLCAQLVDRLSSCKAAIGILDRLSGSYQNEIEIIEESYHRLPTTLPHTVEQIEPTKTLYKTVLERTKPIEQINVDGGKFIREAKIYDLRLHHYRDWLVDEVHPNLEASISSNGKRIRLDHTPYGAGESAISHNLDVLNHRYQGLVSILYDRLNQMIILYPENIELKEFVRNMEPKPLRTFRTELSIYEQQTDVNGTSTPAERISNSACEHLVRTEIVHVNDSIDSPRYVTVTSNPDKMGNKISSSPISCPSVNGDSMYFSEIRSCKKIYKVEESIGTENIDSNGNNNNAIELRGIVHPDTGEILTVHDAIRLRILDVRTGKIATSLNSKSTYIPIPEAVQRGIVTASLAEKLLGPCDVTFNDDHSRSPSLLEAIQRELIDAEKGPAERLKVSNSTITDDIDTTGGTDISIVVKKNLSEAGKSSSFTFKIVEQRPRLSLYDCINHGLTNSDGSIFDRNTGRWCSIETAIGDNLVDCNVREIVDTANDCKISLRDALTLRIIKNGKYYHSLSGEYLSLSEARRRRLIVKPLSLKECVEFDILDEDEGLFKSPTYRTKYNLKRSIDIGLLDADEYKTIFDQHNERSVTLSEALTKGVITSTAMYVDKSSGKMLSISSAVQRGLIYSFSIVPVFDIPAFKISDDDSNENNENRYVSLSTALKEGIIKGGKPITYNSRDGDCMLIPTAVSKGYVKSDVFEMLNQKIGLVRDNNEQTAFSAIVNGYVDIDSGLLVVKSNDNNKSIPFDNALNERLITQQGCALWKSLLAVTLSSRTITKTITRYATSVQFVDKLIENENESSFKKIHPDEKRIKSSIPDDLSKKESIIIAEEFVPNSSTDDNDDDGSSSRSKSEEEMRSLEIPTDGWDLREVISMGLFDPVNGLFIIPGTDRLVTFEECIELRIINRNSIQLLEPNKRRKLSIEKSLEKRILDSTGHYTYPDGGKITMKEAIDRSLFIFKNNDESSSVVSPNDDDGGGNLFRSLQITKTDGKPDIVRITERNDDNVTFKEITYTSSSCIIFDITDDENEYKRFVDSLKRGQYDPESIRVIHPVHKRSINLTEALNEGILNLDEQVCLNDDGKFIDLKDAIKTGILIIPSILTNRITTPELKLQNHREVVDDDNLEDFCDSLKRGQYDPDSIRVIHPTDKRSINLTEALNEGILNLDEQSCLNDNGKFIDLKDAIKTGILIIPTVVTNQLTELISGNNLRKSPKTFNKPDVDVTKENAITAITEDDVDDKTNNDTDNDADMEEPSLAELTRSRVTTEPKYLVSIGKAKSTDVQPRPVVILKRMKKRPVKPNQAVESGFIDRVTASLLENCKPEQNIIDALLANNVDINGGRIVDPRSRLLSADDAVILNIKDATERGILDVRNDSDICLLVPIMYPLTVPQLIRRGLYRNDAILHPITGENLSVQDAIRCDILNPLSKLRHPKTDVLISLQEAVEKRIVRNDLSVKFEDEIPVLEAVRRGDMFLECDENCPLVGISLEVATRHGLYDPRTNRLSLNASETVNLETAIEKGLVIPTDISPYSLVEDVVVQDRATRLPDEKFTLKAVTCTELSNNANLKLTRIVDGRVQEPNISPALFKDNPDLILNGVSYTFNDAVDKGLVDPIKATVKVESSATSISMKEAVKTGLLVITGLPLLAGKAVYDALSKPDDINNVKIKSVQLKATQPSGLSVENTCNNLPITKHLSPKDLSLLGLYDLKRKEFLNSSTGSVTAFEDLLLNSGMFNVDEILVKNVHNGDYVPIMEALEFDLIDRSEGFMTDPATGKTVDFFEALKLGWIVGSHSPTYITNSDKTITFEEAIESNLFDKKTCVVIRPITGERLKLNVAIINRIIEPETVTIRDPANDNLLSLKEAVDSGMVNPNLGVIYNAETDEEYDFAQAFRNGLIFNAPRRSITLTAALKNGIYDNDRKRVLDSLTGEFISLTESIKRLIIDVRLTECLDVLNGKYVTLDRAIETGIIDSDDRFYDTLTNETISLNEATDKNYLRNEISTKITLLDAVHRKYYDPKRRAVFNPFIGHFQTVRQANASDFLDLSTTGVKDAVRNLTIPIDRAISCGIFDPDAGVILKPVEMTLNVAAHKGYIITVADNEQITPVFNPLRTIIQIGGNKILTYDRAIVEGVIDLDNNVINFQAGKIPFDAAVRLRIVKEIDRPLTLTDSIELGVYNCRSGLFLDPVSGKEITLKEAIKERLLDPVGTYLVLPSYPIQTLNEAVRNGNVNGETANVTYENSSIPLSEAVSRRLIVEFDAGRRGNSLQFMLTNSYDAENDTFKNISDGRRLTFREALNSRVLNPDLPLYFDKRREELITLSDACENGIINVDSARFVDPISKRSYTLLEAKHHGYITPLREVNFCRAIQTILLPDNRFYDYERRMSFTLRAALKNKLVTNEDVLVKDVHSRLSTLPEAIEAGIIDDIEAVYKIPSIDGGVTISLKEALRSKLLIDLRREFTFYDCLDNGLINPNTGLCVEPTTLEKLDLKTYILNDVIDTNDLKIRVSGTAPPQNLKTALERGDADIVDGILYVSGKELGTIATALSEGIIKSDVIIKTELTNTNKKKDVKKMTNLQEAIDDRTLESSYAVVKTNSGDFIPLLEAIALGEVDPNQRIYPSSKNADIPSQYLTLNDNIVVYLKKPINLSDAIDKGYLTINEDVVKFTDPTSKRSMSLKDAVTLGFIDPDSALVKDTMKKQLLTLARAYAKGIIDSNRNTVLDKKSSRIRSFGEALNDDIITCRGLPLIEALDYGLYHPVTGVFYDPFHDSSNDLFGKRKYTLERAVQIGLIDATTVLIKDSATGDILTYAQAAEKYLIDPVNGKLIDSNLGKTIDFIKAVNCGFIFPAAIRRAMEEKYRLCDDTLRKFLSWIDDIEDRLANQDVAQEDTHQLLNQINVLKVLKQEIDNNERPVVSCLDQVRQVVATGSEYLSRDEILNLEKKEKSLRTRYDRANKCADKLLRRLLAANDELSKFSNDLNVFVAWMEKACKLLEEKEHSVSNLSRLHGPNESTREFVSDVIAHQADLRFITMAAQKFFDESKEYLTHLNDFRTNLPQRLSHIEPISSQDSNVRATVSTVTSKYRDLLARVNNLSDKLSGIGTKQKEYSDALNAAKTWLKDAEPRANKVLMEPIAADPHTLEDQLNRAKTINNEFVSQGRLIDNVLQALNSLLRSLDGQITTAEMTNLKTPVLEIENKYKQLSSALAEKCQILDTALVQSQGVQDALDGLLHWLNDAENSLKNLTRPASLHKERLEDQLREHRVLQSDIDSHRGSVDNVAQSAQELIATASNPRLAKKIETKLRDVTYRFEKLLDKTAKRGDLLVDIHKRLTSFNEQAFSLERWLSEALDVLPDATGIRINDLVAQRDSQKQALDQTVRDGKALINNKDVTDTAVVRDRVKALENQWKELNQILDEKQRVSKLRSEQQLAYEKLRDQVLAWLNNMEIRVNNFETVAVEIEILKKQMDELKPIAKDYREYNSTIDKVNDLGNALDSLARPDTPTLRRSTTPTKRTSFPTLAGRRNSQDGTISPSRYSIHSPLTVQGSFGAYRSSQDSLILEELTQVQQELTEINNRYSLLGVRLNDRQIELDNIREELRKHLEHLKNLSQFLDKIQRLLPKESVPHSKEDADKMAKQIKAILEEMYEKQAILESTRAGVNDLLRRKPTALGADVLHDDLQEVTTRWKELNDSCKNRIQLLEDLKDFHDVHDNLSNWLVGKDKMMTVLGPISSDSRMVQSQVQQVQVLREEFRTQQPQLNHFTNLGDSILSRIPDRKSPDGQKISDKLSNIKKRWNDLLSRLDERAESLGAAVDTSREFDAGLSRLKDALQTISDQLDDIPLDKEPDEQLRKVQSLERQLEGQRPLLADLEAAGLHLCEVLSDPTSRSDIQAKLSAVNRQYNNLQKKLDHRKAEIEGSLRDGKQFEASCSRTLGWLSELLGTLSERLLISADRDILQQQVDHHEPIYKDVMNKEHEIIMLLNKGKDLLSRTTQQNRSDARSLQRDIDKIQQQWDKIKKDTVDRQTRLQTCMEHCRKYYKSLESFIPWLSQAENKLDTLRPDTFKRKDVEKQLRELSSFRNDVWKHSGEFENMRTLGESFLSACDVDKDIVKQEVAAVKARWDKLNNELFEKTQWLEDAARRLADFSENLRDLAHSVQRCEDKLASHDAIGGAAKDPKMLERIKAVKEEVVNLKKPLLALKQFARDLVDEAEELGVGNASHLLDDVEELSERLDNLQAKLDDRCSRLQSASTALAQYNERIKGLGVNLSNLEQELDAMKPAARDVKTVRTQLDDVGKFIKKVVRAGEDISKAAEAGEYLVDSGFSTDTATTRDQTEILAKQLNKLDERSRNRQTELETVLDKLLGFQQQHGSVLDDITQTGEEFRRLKPVGSEVETIKAQQEEFANFRKLLIEPLSQTVDSVNKTGRNLIQSAAGGVNTVNLEKDLEKLNDRWNALKEKLNERDRKLDVGLLQSGKFQEALDGLSKWLTDTEEMVANQKPPSADYKVAKAQLQEQKFLNKMLLDRQNSMSSLFAMGNEVAANADVSERKAIESQMQDLMRRFDKLSNGAAQRMEALQQAMIVAKEFQDKLIPVLEWLDVTEKKVKDMELVPTDEEKIQQRIKEHDTLHKDIIKKKPVLTELTDIASSLMALVGEDEASGVADKMQDIAERYTSLVDASDNVGQLLQASRSGLRHLVLTYQDLQAWMEGVDNRLNRYKILPVHTEKLLRQMEDLVDVSEEISNRQNDVDSTVDSGLELMKHISNDEAIQLKDKLDSLQRRYNDLISRGADLLKRAQEGLPLVQQFHNSHNRLVDWMMDAESQLQVAEPKEDDIARLELDIQEFRPILENINLIGPQLCQMSPGEGAATIEGLVTRDNRRFDAIVEQIQRKAERIHISKQRSLEVIGDIDELLDWFREAENQLRDSEPPSSEPDIIRLQLKEHKALNDDISSQKGRVRDVLSSAKKVLRESAYNEDVSTIREKMEDLKDMMDIVSKLSSDRLGTLEQALPLAEHFHQSHADLGSWLDDMERQVSMLSMPALRPDLITQQQDRNEMFMQSILEHKPLVDKLNKTGEALIRLCNPEEGSKVQDILDSDNSRYAALRQELRQRQQALEKALQETSQFSDKLEGMLRALANTADLVSNVEPISAHPPRIREQIDENATLVEDLEKREEAFQAVKKAANDVINKAPNAADPAVKDMKRKLEKLNSLWNDVQKATSDRGTSLEEALILAERFWEELQTVMATLRDLQDSLSTQEPPAVQPAFIQQQQEALQEIKAEIDQTKPEVEHCRASGQKLMKICGEPDKPEVKKHIEDLDNAWDNITALFAKREENLINAMEKAMEFHETLQDLLKFLDKAEIRFEKLGPLGSDIDAVKHQIAQLKQFKSDVDPHMVKVEALNRQAQELTERTSAEQAAALKEPLSSVNRRWDDLLKGVVERQRQLEHALLRLGQFHHALAELLTWIEATNRTLDNELKPVAGDPQLLEVELAKLKVLVNDIQAHQSSVDTLNDAGRQLIESSKGTDEASSTQDKLSILNRHWRDLLQKAADRQLELEESLRDAQRFYAEIQDLLSWLGEVDSIIAASKPVGGLPETASEQLERFMEVYNELEENRPKVETVLAQGQEYLKKSPTGHASNLQLNLKTLKQRWDSVTARANDKKIKLEIALKEATEFHDALQAFIDWLTKAEKVLTSLKPVSRVLSTILTQIEEHKAFQKDVSSHREAMLNLDKKGTHLKYFSQKQDVILIKNLLISVQHRWERVVAKSAERTRALDHGYKEAREFHDAWSGLMNWLLETEKGLDELIDASSVGNDPEKIKQRLAKHRDFQRGLSGKQTTYDTTMRMGKSLKEKAPKFDEPHIKQMLTELKEKWNAVCSKSVDRQRKLEEALLYCGQFKDALEALLDWLKKAVKQLSDEGPVHGDLDTVTALLEQHGAFEDDLENRSSQLESVKQTANDLLSKANSEDAGAIRSKLEDINKLWNETVRLTEKRSKRLLDALKEAEELHKSVNMLLEWLSDAEMKLRFVGTLPDDEQETRNQLMEHEKFMRELLEKELEKDYTINLAQKILEKAHPDAVSVIKHWITIIQSRWDEVSTWAKQRDQRLRDHLRSLQDLDTLLEELLAWLFSVENKLLNLESEPLPEEIPAIEKLIEEHKEFMESMAQKQHDVDTVCKAKQVILPVDRRGGKKSIPVSSTEDTLYGSSADLTDAQRKQSFKSSRDNLADKRYSRTSPGLREKTDSLPHIGPRFAPKGSKGSEPTFRNSRCKQLWDKWRNVWLLAWERQRRLQERLDYLKEVEKVRNFSWDDWRKRFLRFMNHKKSRLTDLFRKMDKNNDGLIPRDDFINGIMTTKFDTSRLEMNAVADLVDPEGTGLIDWKKFIAALRPDWEEKPASEAEKIHDEVKRLVMLCTCRQKFRVFQVGEGKYRFGDSQKLRLVRILRSTVMVRVGGGWVALDEFLVKNDPCRVELLPIPDPYIPEEHEGWCPYSLTQLNSKGRTNIELREHFILPEGVSQSMSPFKPKRSTSINQRPSSLQSNTGPIVKIRERTNRSIPLNKSGGMGCTIGTPDSLSDNESSPCTPRTPIRKAATPTFKSGHAGSLPSSRTNSRPASRQGSKPPSRHGSNLSLDSTDDATPSRIPRRSTTSSRSSVSGGVTTTSSGARKLTSPAVNGTLSRTRSPSGFVSPSSDKSNSSIYRTSSIPTLSGVGTSGSSNSSRIPVYIGLSPTDTSRQISICSSCSSSSGRTSNVTPTSSHIPQLKRTRTPSGSSTPLPGTTRVTRKTSSASDSSKKSSKAPMPIEARAPFRL